MQSGIEGDRKALLGFLSAIIEHDRICAGHDNRTLDRIFKAACRDGSMIAGYLRGILITQVPLERVHPGLDRSELRFLFSDLLICGSPLWSTSGAGFPRCVPVSPSVSCSFSFFSFSVARCRGKLRIIFPCPSVNWRLAGVLPS